MTKINKKFLKVLKKYNLEYKFSEEESNSRVNIYKSIEDFGVIKIPLHVFLTNNSFSFHSTLCNIKSISNKQEVVNIVNYINVKFSGSPAKIFLDEGGNIILESHTFFYGEENFHDVMFVKLYSLVMNNIGEILQILIPLLSELEDK